MNTLNNSLVLISRPDVLDIYAGILARIAQASNLVHQDNISLSSIAQKPSLYETAYLKEGETGVIKLVCWELLQMGFVEIRDNQIQVKTYFQHISHLEPIEQAIFDYLHIPKTGNSLLDNQDLNRAIATYCAQYQQSLVNQGYLKSDGKKYLTLGISGLLILGLSLSKPLVGLAQSYRYIMMLAMVAMPKASLAIAATAWFSTRSKSTSNKLTTKGKKYLTSLEQASSDLRVKISTPPSKPNYETSLIFILQGFDSGINKNISAYTGWSDLFINQDLA